MNYYTQSIHIRSAGLKDLPDLLHLEQIAFTTDRFTQSRIEYLLTRARASIYVAEIYQRTVGCAYVLWRKNDLSGRIYNIATVPDMENQGIGKALLTECEMEAARRGCKVINLEVKHGNIKAVTIYEKAGYEAVRMVPGFYEDGSTALKMTKTLTISVPESVHYKTPHYAETGDFACDSACLLMIMKYFHPRKKHQWVLETKLWKETTLNFRASGIGSMNPFGIALAAAKRNYAVRLITSTDKIPFVNSVKNPDKIAMIHLVYQDIKKRATELGVSATAYDFTFEDIKSGLLRGHIPIMLISTYRLTGVRGLHWVVITGFDNSFVYLNDPWAAKREKVRKSKKQTENTGIPYGEFYNMSRYGKDGYRSVIFIGKTESLLPQQIRPRKVWAGMPH